MLLNLPNRRKIDDPWKIYVTCSFSQSCAAAVPNLDMVEGVDNVKVILHCYSLIGSVDFPGQYKLLNMDIIFSLMCYYVSNTLLL